MNVTDALKTLQHELSDLHVTQHKIQRKTRSNTENSVLSEDISRLEGLEKRLIKVEEVRRQNSSQLQSIVEMVTTISRKIEKISNAISVSKGQQQLPSTSSPGNSLLIPPENSTPSLQIGLECAQLSLAEHVLPTMEEHEDTSVKQDATRRALENNHIHTISSDGNSQGTNSQITIRKLKSPEIKPEVRKLKRPEVKSEVRELKRPEVKSEVRELKRPEVKSEVQDDEQNRRKTNIKEKTKKHKCKSGLKLCRANEYLDNRTCYHDKKRCYEGELIAPVVETEVVQTVSKPNIVAKEENIRTSKKPNTEHVGKKTGIMTMAQMAERDFDHNQQVHTFEEWTHIATQSQLEVQLKMILNLGKNSSRGHKYLLLLDASESMSGDKFDMMKKTAINYLDGLQEISLRYSIRDNVGLACFGQDTKLILPPVADYDEIKAEIATLQPYGPSPLAAGLLMALSGLTHCSLTTIANHEFKPYIILMTDGMPTRVEALNEEDRDQTGVLAVSDLYTNLIRHQEIEAAVQNIAKRGIKIYCVPFGSANTDIINYLAAKTFGKVIPSTQIHRLCRNTQNLFHASEIAQKLESATDLNKSLVKTAVKEADQQQHDIDDDITDNVMFLLNPVNQYGGRFKQTKWRAVSLGARVRRGPDWHWKNQDSNMAGTVIGEDEDGMIWVEWDSGYRNCYHYNEDKKVYDIKPVNEPRRLVDELIAVGCQVKRGKDWRFADQDGGKGSRGTVLRVEANGKVVVYWERARLGIYKFASDDVFEVEVCEHGRTIHSPDLIEFDDHSDVDTSGLPLILPSHTGKALKPVTAVWQYQEGNEQWTSYDEDINVKVERAFSRNPSGKSIIEMDKTIYIVQFPKMIQENQTDKTVVSVRRLEQDGSEGE